MWNFISVDALNLWVISIIWGMKGRTPILTSCIFLILSIYRQFWSVLWSCCSSFWQFGKQQSMTNPVKVKLGSTFFQMHLYICATIGLFQDTSPEILGFCQMGPFPPQESCSHPGVWQYNQRSRSLNCFWHTVYVKVSVMRLKVFCCWED